MTKAKETFAKIKQVFWLSRQVFRLAWETQAVYTFGLIITAAASVLIPTGQIYLGKLIIDQLVAAVSQNASGEVIFLYLGLAAGLAILQSFLSSTQTYFGELMRDYLNRAVQSRVLRKIASLDFTYFDNDEFHDKVMMVEREASWRPGHIITGQIDVLSQLVALTSTFSLLLVFGGWLIALVLGITIPALLVGIRYARYRYSITDSRVPESKKVDYLTQLITWRAAGEVKLFGLADYITNEYLKIYERFIQQTREFARGKGAWELAVDLLNHLVYYGVYVWVIIKALAGRFSVGDVSLYSSAFNRSQRSARNLTSRLADTYEHLLFMEDYVELMNFEPQITSPPKPETFSSIDRAKEGIEFREVGFRYQEDQKWILKDINLQIPPNTNLAIVGENGAGKTTLIKLLLRFYDPQKGQILINGTDLREYDLESYYDKIAALQQNFTKYQLTVQENIGFGRLEEIGNLEKIKQAAREAGIAEYVENELSEGYQSQLGTRFEGGVDLSVGQWQRMALARAFMRDGEILILDEPTAALDAKAEYEVFKRFVDLVEDKISILISHRFSTVRLADEIVVLDNGQIIEQGTHQELLEREGQYATMFNLQAEGYR